MLPEMPDGPGPLTDRNARRYLSLVLVEQMNATDGRAHVQDLDDDPLDIESARQT
jgi:hypothetical protein